MNFDIPLMTWQKSYEIRIVLLQEMPSCKDYLSLLSYFDPSQRFSLPNSKNLCFNALELLKYPTMQDITEKMNFSMPFMIWGKTFEIRIVLLGQLPSCKGSYHTFDLNPRLSSPVYNSTP